MSSRPWLLMLTGGAATLSIVTAAMSAAADPQSAAVATRLGATIAKEMKAREAQAAERARALKLREQMVKATENRLKADINARSVKDQAAAAAEVSKAEGPPQPNQFDALARVYQAMKPAKAATVFEQLDLDVQVAVAKRMRERSTAMIMAAMSPGAAARLSMALAGKRPTVTAMRQPLPVAANGGALPGRGAPATTVVAAPAAGPAPIQSAAATPAPAPAVTPPPAKK